jgi:hypothetical protein
MWMDFLGRYSEKVGSPLERILVPGLIWSQLNSRHLGSGTCTGAMWTPGYWELHDDGPYVFRDGYWASEVGWCGGINYGIGYQGVGFAFGEWRNGHFAYSTACTNLDKTAIHNPYSDSVILTKSTLESFWWPR